MIISRHANLSQLGKEPADVGRGTCQFRNMCSRGCPYGAYFSTNSATLPAAEKTGRLKLATDAVVESIIYDEKKKKQLKRMKIK